ncbi:RRM domain-containing protein [Plasmodiophora brassicae]
MADLDDCPFVVDKVGTTCNGNGPVAAAASSGIDASKSTVFVRNLPFDMTDQQFEAKFEEVGPVKRAFIVTGKGAQGSKGFGFVVFSDPADAEAAVAQLHLSEMSGRKIKVELAKRPGTQDDKEEGSTAAKRAPAPRRRFSGKAPSAVDRSVIVLEGLPESTTEKSLLKRMRKFGSVASVQFPSPESSAQYQTARITFSSGDIALKAVRKMDKKVLDGAVIRAGFPVQKCARVIVRNLPFNCTTKRVRTVLKQFGPISEVTLPMKADESGSTTKNNKGFAFVQFEHIDDATKAVSNGASLKIGGRNIAVDWALSKAHYEQRAVEQSGADEDEAADGDVSDDGQNYEAAADGADGTKGEEGSDDSEDDAANDSDLDDPEHVESESDMDDDDDAEDDEEHMDDDDDEEVDVTDEEDRNDVDRMLAPKVSRDVQEGRTVFVRNLPFDVTEGQVSDLFSRFGTVKYAMLVTDKELERPKGTAFVQFGSAESANAAVEYASKGRNVDERSSRNGRKRPRRTMTENGLQLGGRPLDVVIAVDRSQAARLQESGSKVKKDDRKCAYLLREGHINESSPAAEGLSKQDLTMRSKLYKEASKKIANPNFIMSKFRLTIHNLADGLTESDLKSAFLKGARQHCPDSKPIIKQCIIVRDKTRLDADGKPRSKHYGFVEFTEHDHALAALRALNNNPMAFGKKGHRPIVMFAVDDVRKLALRRRRLEKNRMKGMTKKLENELAADVPVQESQKRTRKPAKARPQKQQPATQLALAESTPKPQRQMVTRHELASEEDREEARPAKKPKRNSSVKQGAKRARSTDDESKFDAMVRDYKAKFFGNERERSISKRWFE